MTDENTPLLLQTGIEVITSKYSTKPIIHIGFSDGTTECRKVVKILGQEIILSNENIDLITCQGCLEEALNILGIKQSGWFHPDFFIKNFEKNKWWQNHHHFSIYSASSISIISIDPPSFFIFKSCPFSTREGFLL